MFFNIILLFISEQHIKRERIKNVALKTIIVLIALQHFVIRAW